MAKKDEDDNGSGNKVSLKYNEKGDVSLNATVDLDAKVAGAKGGVSGIYKQDGTVGIKGELGVNSRVANASTGLTVGHNPENNTNSLEGELAGGAGAEVSGFGAFLTGKTAGGIKITSDYDGDRDLIVLEHEAGVGFKFTIEHNGVPREANPTLIKGKATHEFEFDPETGAINHLNSKHELESDIVEGAIQLADDAKEKIEKETPPADDPYDIFNIFENLFGIPGASSFGASNQKSDPDSFYAFLADRLQDGEAIQLASSADTEVLRNEYQAWLEDRQAAQPEADSSLAAFNAEIDHPLPKPLGTDAASQPEDTQTDLEHLAALRAFEDNQNAPDTLQALEDFTGKDFDDLDATFGIEGLTWADGDLEDPFAEYDEDSPDYQPPTPGEIDLLGNINQLIDSSDLLNGQVLSDIGGLITDSGITDLDIIDDIGRLASQGGENLFGVLGEIRELAFNNPLGDIDVLNDVTNLIDTVGITGDAVLGGVNRLVQRSGLTDTVAVRRVGQLLNQRGVVQVAAQAAGQFAEVPLSFARDLGNIEVIDDIEAFSKVKDRTQSFLTQQTPNGWVLMMLGKYMFSLSNAAYQQMTRSIEYRWPAEARIGRRPALQFVGTGQETISLSGSIYPSYAGGLRQIDAMRELAGSGEPLILMDGLGYNHHEWCIVRIKETSRMVLENSAPRRVDFELELSRYGRDTVESDASQASL